MRQFTSRFVQDIQKSPSRILRCLGKYKGRRQIPVSTKPSGTSIVALVYMLFDSYLLVTGDVRSRAHIRGSTGEAKILARDKGFEQKRRHLGSKQRGYARTSAAEDFKTFESS